MNHPPGPPQQSKPNSKSPPNSKNQSGWFDRHRILSIILQIVAIPILGGAAFFLWMLGAEKYAIGAGVFLICLVVAMIRAQGHNALSQASSAEQPPSPQPRTPRQ